LEPHGVQRRTAGHLVTCRARGSAGPLTRPRTPVLHSTSLRGTDDDSAPRAVNQPRHRVRRLQPCARVVPERTRSAHLTRPAAPVRGPARRGGSPGGAAGSGLYAYLACLRGVRHVRIIPVRCMRLTNITRLFRQGGHGGDVRSLMDNRAYVCPPSGSWTHASTIARLRARDQLLERWPIARGLSPSGRRRTVRI
jgi:hypothetical protein